MDNNVYDVVVVGAGFAGLSAALDLRESKKTFLVLEARNRVGGRSWTEQYIDHKSGATCWIDMGAQWVHSEQKAILKLAKDLGINTEIAGNPAEGKILLIFGGERYEIDISDFHELGHLAIASNFMKIHFPTDFEEYHENEEALDIMAKKFDSGAPWKPSGETPENEVEQVQKSIIEWDSMTAQSWIDEKLKSDGAKFLFRIKCLLCFAAPPSDISLLHVLHYINCAGFSGDLNNATQYRIQGGTQAVADAAFNKIEDQVRLNEPVFSVEQPDPTLDQHGQLGVTLVKTNQHTYKAKQVIMAIPPAIASKVSFSPQLPARRLQFNQRMPMGSSIKCHLVYEKPFWEEKDYCGIVLSDEHILPFIVNSSVPGRKKPGVLGCFIDSVKVREFMNKSDEEIKEHVTKEIESVFNTIGEIPQPEKVYIANWSKEIWSGGCYAGIMAPGVWTGYQNTLRESFGAIHWASTELSSKWFAYMDGAVHAGKLAAKTAIGNLDAHQVS